MYFSEAKEHTMLIIAIHIINSHKSMEALKGNNNPM
jgi:hypothetical protein